MTPQAILQRLDGLGVALGRLGDGRLGVSRAAVALIPTELRRQIVAHEPELYALIEARARAWSADPPAMAWHTRPGQDPRPDLPRSDLWSRMLLLAAGDAGEPGGVYGRLLACRACGGLLERRGDRWRLAPTIDPTERLSVWADRQAWDRDAQRWLRPRAREIAALLRQLRPLVETPDG